MSNDLHLALRLEGPLQSWGFEDRFNRRKTGLLPTKSGVIGLCCAAMGIARGSEREKKELPRLAGLTFLSISGIPPKFGGDPGQAITRLEDFHTVQDTRTADGKVKKSHITYRTYLCDARNGAVLSGNPTILEELASKLQDPVWGLWLGRKACIPTSPVFAGLFPTESEALASLLGDRSLSLHLHARDALSFEQGTDTIQDHPLAFSDPRIFSARRIDLSRPIQP